MANYSDVIDVCMAQLRRLNDPELDDAALERECGRAKAIGEMGKTVVSATAMAASVVRLGYEMGDKRVSHMLLSMGGGERGDDGQDDGAGTD